MNKEKQVKTLSIVALFVAVLGLSIGFAAFEQTLTIKSSAEVNPAGTDFNVIFSTRDDVVSTDPVNPTVTGTGATATNATIDTNSNSLIIKDLHAVFTEPNQKAQYTFYTKNTGQYTAYLKSIAYANVSGKNEPRVCTPKETTGPNAANNTLVQAACDDIRVTVSLSGTLYTQSVAAITGHSVAVGSSEEIIVTIEYLAGGDTADGPFDVEFGDITIAYSSVN
ncbi:MAG: hypothetical protein IJI22_02965 [Bacilli bacterium]|nr:hypothetical protein [Bacilli bacterium]